MIQLALIKLSNFRIPAVVVLILAKKNGRLKELAMSREKDQNKPQNLAYTGQNLVS